MSLKGDNDGSSGLMLSKIPNVQEMVKIDPKQVPEIFIRSNIDMGDAERMHHLSPQIPIIDLEMLRKGSQEELLKLDMACKNWGFFQLMNAVPTQLFQEMKDATADFLNLPLIEKEKYAMPTQQNGEGYGHCEVDKDENKFDWSDALILLTKPTHSRNDSFWPKNPIQYKMILDKYSDKVSQVGVELLNYLSGIVGKNNPISLEGPAYFLAIYYPPCSKSDQVLGMSPHFDSNSITLVMQDQNDVIELEIKYEGGWVPVHPIQNALVCNIGDSVQKWSNERYKSVEHRVVANNTKVRSVHEVVLLPADEKIIGDDSVEKIIGEVRSLHEAVLLPAVEKIIGDDSVGGVCNLMMMNRCFQPRVANIGPQYLQPNSGVDIVNRYFRRSGSTN